jgi:hypothetical protein
MIRDRPRRPFSASEKFDLEKVELPLKERFHPLPVFRAEAQADAAIGAEMARYMNQLAVDAGAFDDFFRTERVAHGFNKDDAVVVRCHDR